MKNIFFSVLLLLCFRQGNAATVTREIWLNRGTFTAVNGASFPAYALNESAVYSSYNAVVRIATGDSLILTVHNTDVLAHSFAVEGISSGNAVPASGSVTLHLHFPAQGVFACYAETSSPVYSYLGAAGMIAVDGSSFGSFYWNLHEWDSVWCSTLASGGMVDWSQHDPKFFTVNGYSHPDTDNDSTATVRGNTGDTIRIYMVNTGRSVHSIHLHGYHVRLVYAGKQASRVNWIKDSQPVLPMEGMILELVPDKPGMFPVHDHNLLALTGDRWYPYGLMVMMYID